ncbi:zinc-binding dehydrogenase [Candidatus Poribacteria bacterium]|nr:zinc-binding dehydrogenase [Candidatus Poribacteria bacterium]
MNQNLAQTAIFHGVDKPFEIIDVPIQTVPDTVLVRVSLATICGSDLHTVSGRRGMDVPCVLGHEAIGVVDAPTSLKSDKGEPLEVGDRITWSLTTACGECHYCSHINLPQKCESMFKYGHALSEGENALTGGFSTHIQLKKGTSIHKIPDTLTDEEVVPINCALGTVVNGIESIGTEPGKSAVVHGAGMLGIYAACYLRSKGYKIVGVVDKQDVRLNTVLRYGATHTFNAETTSKDEISKQLDDLTDGRGVDLVVEVSGAPPALPDMIDWLGIGGKCLTLGYVYPLDGIPFNVHQLVTKCITLKGVHNYHPNIMDKIVSFIEEQKSNYPFAELIGKVYPLSEINDAFTHAFKQEIVRIAISP